MRSGYATRTLAQPPDMETRRLVITGLVQGIGYRFSMAQEAARLGVRGWVRNRRDGSVEAVVAGTPEAVAAIIAWARRGPSAARVDQIMIELDIDPSLDGFEQRPTV